MHIAIINFFSILISLTVGADVHNLEMSLFEKSEQIVLTRPIQKYQLTYWPIITHSEEVFIDDLLLSRPHDYSINYNSGEIGFEKEIPSSATLCIRYKIIPIGIKKKYTRVLFPKKDVDQISKKRANPVLAKTEAQRSDMSEDRQRTPESTLQVSGTKSFSISLGSKRSLSPDQALNVNISGNVSENVSVLAILSDQNLPFQPEGTTEALRDIDQKLIKITTPHFSATMGDFTANLGNSEFVFFPRALEGVSTSVDLHSVRIDVIPSAIPKGRSHSKEIYGIEGQSQYRIDVDGQFVVVKAGSEIVWLNGEKMKRGKDNDYVIRDYGDPIIEFTSKHLITSHDVIRVDFEYIQEDAVYGKELYGANFGLDLWNDRAKVGLSYAVEADDKDKPYILLDDETIDKLRRNETSETLDLPTGETATTGTAGRPVPPQKHSVWGINGLLELGRSTFLRGEFATDRLDTNTFSTLDEIKKNHAWRISANSSFRSSARNTDLASRTKTEFLQANFDARSYDAGFSPVGGTTKNRSRMLYEERYQNESYGDAFLGEQISPATGDFDERSFQFDLQYQPFKGIFLDAGFGKTEEREQLTNPLTPSPLNHQSNWRRGFRVNIEDFPNIYNRYQENSSQTDGVENFRTLREIWQVRHRLGKLSITASKNLIKSLDSELSDAVNRNHKHDGLDFDARLLDFKWMNISGKFGMEENYEKKQKFAVDGVPLSYGDWELDTSAKTWMLSVDSKPKKWLDTAMNFSRRVFKMHRDFGSDTTTNLANFNLRLTPLSRSIELGMNYEVDKKLSTEKIEIYTNEIFGRKIEAGEGTHVKVDEYHYQEDYEKGDYIRIVKSVGDKPVSSVDAEFRLRFLPRRMVRQARRSTYRQAKTTQITDLRDSPASKNGAGSLRNGQSDKVTQTVSLQNEQPLWKKVIKTFEIDARLDVTEEQEEPDFTALYLLRNLLKTKTIFGRQIQKYRIEFSPSIFLSAELMHYRRRLLNKRINSVKRRQNSQEWRWGINLTPIAKLSFSAEYEKTTSQEKLTNLGIDGVQPINFSDIHSKEKTGSLGVRYELANSLSVKFQGEIETEEGFDLFERNDGSESKTNTRQSSIETGVIYSALRKGRLDLSYRAAYGKSSGELPIARYGFYDGISHEVRVRADYKLRKFTDLIIRLNYRFFTSELTKPEHRAEIEAVAEL